MKLLLLLIIPVLSFGQNDRSLSPESKVFLKYVNSTDGADVNGNDAINMLKSAIVDKTPLDVVDLYESSDYTIELTVVKKFGDARRAMVSIKENKSGIAIIETKWRKGTANIYHGMSGTRHAIAKIVNQDIQKIIK